MGFYSFYRIFKDIVRSLFGSKGWKIFLILLIVIIIFGFNKNVFASSSNLFGLSENKYNTIKSLQEQHPDYSLWLAGVNRGQEFIFLIKSADTNKFYGNYNSIYVYPGYADWIYFEYYPETNTYKSVWSGHTFSHTNQSFSDLSANFIIYTDNTFSSIFYSPPELDTMTQPSFISTSAELEDENNSYIKINQGSYMDSIYLRLYNTSSNSLLINTKLTNYEDYMQREDLEDPFSNLIFSIPYSALPSFNLTAENNYEWRLVYTNSSGVLSNVSIFFTSTVSQDIGSVSNKELNESIDKVNDSIKETNDSIKETNNSIKDMNDKLFSDDYDESKINISTAESDKVDDTQITNFVTSLLQNIQNIATGNWNSVETISFDLRFCR